MLTNRAVKWRKQGRIFAPDGDGFFKSHATRPVPFVLRNGGLRLFFSSRSADDIPFPTYIDVDPDNPAKVLTVNRDPLMQLGRRGAFDDSGITPVSVLRHSKGNWLYYVGWKRRRVSVTIEASIGLAYIGDDERTLVRAYEGPLIGQDTAHPLMVAAPFVLQEEGRFRMWYCSGTDWREGEAGPEPIYTVFYGESQDGLRWNPCGGPIIQYGYDGEVISAPWVIRDAQGYRMWYSTRGYVTREAKNYAIGYAESIDGLVWKRLDHLAGIVRSQEGWDSEMVCYPAVITVGSKTHMFYCGNGVGRGGIGYAVADHA